MSFGCIYKIQFPNGKHYIGLTTTSIEQRRKEHTRCAKSGDTKCLYIALRKYNMVDTFELIVIDTGDTLEELQYMEIEYIISYNSYYKNGYGYNMTHGGEGANGYVYTEEDNKKNSERRTQYFKDHPEAREEMSEIKKKYFKDHPEAREKKSETTTQYFKDHPEAKQKMSETTKKRWENTEAREKMIQSQKKGWENPEAKQKMSKKMKKYNEDNPEAGKEQGEKMKKYNEDHPELRKQILDTKGKNKPFDVSKVDGTFIKTFTYQFEAIQYLREKFDIKSTIKISYVLSGIQKSSAGFVFKYK